MPPFRQAQEIWLAVEAVLTEPNKAGETLVWPLWGYQGVDATKPVRPRKDDDGHLFKQLKECVPPFSISSTKPVLSNSIVFPSGFVLL
jgi:hypothetical protein